MRRDKRRLPLRELGRYGGVTVGSYAFLFSATALLVEVAGVAPQPAYTVALSVTYVGVYLASAYFVFRVRPSPKNALRFVFWLAVFWALNNGLFALLHGVLSISYLVAMLVNVVFLGPVRYLVNRHVVYSRPP